MGVSLGSGTELKSKIGAPEDTNPPITGGITQTLGSPLQSFDITVNATGDIIQILPEIIQAASVDVPDPSPPGIIRTVEELIVDPGGAGETRTIVDPLNPGANGNVTWVAADPLTGSDPGDKARWWARYPDSAGAFWRRNDWNALTVGEGSANAISLDWITLEENEDASSAFQELLDQYMDGAEGNALSIKGPEDISEMIVGGLTATGDGSASAWYWYRPTTNRCTVWTKPWSLGTEDLLAKTWTNLGSNRWSTSVGETVLGLRACDPANKPSSHTNSSKGPWLMGMQNAASAAAVTTTFDWFYGSGTLTVYATSDPSTYFAAGTSATTAAMQYFTTLDGLELHGRFTDIHKVYIEGGASFFHNENGMHSRGRNGPDPWGGIEDNSTDVITGWVFTYTQATFVDAGSFCTFLMAKSEYLVDGLSFETIPANHIAPAKVTIGGINSCKFRFFTFNSTSLLTPWLHGYQTTDSAGEAFRNIRLWGETSNGWDGSVSNSGPANATEQDNKTLIRNWPFARSERLNSFRKVTGQLEGYGFLPFTGFKGGVQLGESLADPFKFLMIGGTMGVGGDYATYTPNGRPVYFDDNLGPSIQYDKADVFNSVRGGTNFLWIENKGAVDPITFASLNVDLRDHPTASALNVLADPGALDLGLRNALTSFETTVPETPSGYAGVDLKLTGVGQGKMGWGEVDFRYPYNWNGYWTIHGINDACHMILNQIPTDTTVTDITFADMFSGGQFNPEVAISIWSETSFAKPDNVVLNGVTLQGNRTIRIGEATGGAVNKGRMTPPYRVFLTDMTITGDTRTAIDIHPFSDGNFNEGHPIVIEANNVTNWDAGIVVGIPDGTLHGDDVYFSDDGGTTWYEPGYVVGGSKTAKSAPPNLVGLNTAWRHFGPGTSGAPFTPQFFHDGSLCIAVFWFDGNPGTITPASGFSAIADASENLSDGSLYVRAFRGVFATGTDLWDESGITQFNDDSIRTTFTWQNSVEGWGYTHEHTGQNASPIGNADSTPHNTAATTHTAPTISVSTDSMILSLIGMVGNGLVTDFRGALSPWMTRLSKNQFGNRWGQESNAFLGGGDKGISFCAAEIYSGASGSKAGCEYEIDANLKAITTSIEIKT